MPEPMRLTMFRYFDNCQFCTNPKGDVFCHYISTIDLFGFLSCEQCHHVAGLAVNDWRTAKSSDLAKKFGKKRLRIQRSSGAIEDDWVINPDMPMIRIIDSVEYINCKKDDPQTMISKWIRVKDFLDLNTDETPVEQQAGLNMDEAPDELEVNCVIPIV
jgi:hypothetical protein